MSALEEIVQQEIEITALFQTITKLEKELRGVRLQVAQLAGVPKSVIRAARKHLDKLESSETTATGQNNLQGSLFVPPTLPVAVAPHPVFDALADLKPDELSPREALEKLYALKALSDRE